MRELSVPAALEQIDPVLSFLEPDASHFSNFFLPVS